MGLDTSHGCWHGPYSAFKAFRDQVKIAAKEHYDYEPNYDGHPPRAFMGWWDPQMDPEGHSYEHILDVFFVHSDCEGWIFPQDAGLLADALDALVGYMPETDGLAWSTDRQRLRDFVTGLREAAEEWMPVRFH